MKKATAALFVLLSTSSSAVLDRETLCFGMALANTYVERLGQLSQLINEVDHKEKEGKYFDEKEQYVEKKEQDIIRTLEDYKKTIEEFQGKLNKKAFTPPYTYRSNYRDRIDVDIPASEVEKCLAYLNSPEVSTLIEEIAPKYKEIVEFCNSIRDPLKKDLDRLEHEPLHTFRDASEPESWEFNQTEERYHLVNSNRRKITEFNTNLLTNPKLIKSTENAPETFDLEYIKAYIEFTVTVLPTNSSVGRNMYYHIASRQVENRCPPPFTQEWKTLGSDSSLRTETYFLHVVHQKIRHVFSHLETKLIRIHDLIDDQIKDWTPDRPLKEKNPIERTGDLRKLKYLKQCILSQCNTYENNLKAIRHEIDLEKDKFEAFETPLQKQILNKYIAYKKEMPLDTVPETVYREIPRTIDRSGKLTTSLTNELTSNAFSVGPKTSVESRTQVSIPKMGAPDIMEQADSNRAVPSVKDTAAPLIDPQPDNIPSSQILSRKPSEDATEK